MEPVAVATDADPRWKVNNGTSLSNVARPGSLRHHVDCTRRILYLYLDITIAPLQYSQTIIVQAEQHYDHHSYPPASCLA